jgi:hypothetical protein
MWHLYTVTAVLFWLLAAARPDTLDGRAVPMALAFLSTIMAFYALISKPQQSRKKKNVDLPLWHLGMLVRYEDSVWEVRGVGVYPDDSAIWLDIESEEGIRRVHTWEVYLV